MPTLTINHNLGRLAARLVLAKQELAVGAGIAIPEIAAHIAQTLSDASPVGYDPQEPSTPPGDASGKLAQSYHVVVSSPGGRARAVVFTDQPLKLKWVRYGTGIYGPLGQRIFPKRAKYLRWEGSDGNIHFALSVAGMRPNDFVTPVLDEGAAFAVERLREVVVGALQIIRE